MADKKIREKILRLYRYKSISNKQFDFAMSNLERLRDSDVHFYYFHMGKLNCLFGDPNKGIVYLKKAVELKPHYAGSYYNMFRGYVKAGKFDKAYESFCVFLYANEKEVDFSFVVHLLQTIKFLDMDFDNYLKLNVPVKESNVLGYNDLSDNPVLNGLYSEVIAAFNARNYAECLENLQKMDFIIRRHRYPVEVDTLMLMVKAIRDKEANYYFNKIRENKISSEDNNSYCDYLLRLFELGKYTQKGVLKEIELIIDGGSLFRANLLLDRISQRKDFEEYLDMVEYLRGFIREKRAFVSLGAEKQKKYTEKRLTAKRLYRKKRNYLSLGLYKELKAEFGLPICDYYIGKIMFREGKFEQAKALFLSYLEQGGVKTEKAYMFLGKIEQIRHNDGEAKYYFDKMRRIHSVFPRDYEYLPDNEYMRRKKAAAESSGYTPYDDVKIRRMHGVSMSEEDFVRDDEFTVMDFYEVGIDGKLSIIRGLLRSGDVRVANKLFEEVQRECTSEEKDKVKQFDKNRKIYRNQNRCD